jgi:hypothetical protein
MRPSASRLFALAVLSLTCVAEGDEQNQRYVEGDEVILSTQRIAVLWSAKPPLQNHPFCVCLVEFCDGVQVTLWVNKVGRESPGDLPFLHAPVLQGQIAGNALTRIRNRFSLNHLLRTKDGQVTYGHALGGFRRGAGGKFTCEV